MPLKCDDKPTILQYRKHENFTIPKTSFFFNVLRFSNRENLAILIFIAITKAKSGITGY